MGDSNIIAGNQRLRRDLVLIGVGLGVLYWIIDSIIVSLILSGGSLLTQLFNPTAHEIWHRSVVAVFTTGFGFHASFLMNRRKRAEDASKSSEYQYQRLVEVSPDAIGVQDDSGIVFMNATGARLLGATSPEQLHGKKMWQLVRPADRAQVAQWYRNVGQDGRSSSHQEMTFARLDGTSFDAEAAAIPIEYEAKAATQLIIRDISHLRRAEKEIKQRNEELKALNLIATTVSQSLDLEKILNSALEQVLKLDMFGDQANGLIHMLQEGDPRLKLIAMQGIRGDHPCLLSAPELGECLCGRVVETGERMLVQSSIHDARHTRSWSEMSDHQDICLPLSARGKVFGAMNLQLPQERTLTERNLQVLSAVADQIGVAIENARLFNAVKEQRSRLLALGTRIAEVEASERKRLAQELHDQVGQNLTALGININIIRSQLTEETALAAKLRADDSLALLKETTERIRGVMSDLRPPMLDDYGLVASLRWYGAQLSLRSGVSVSVQGEEESTLLPQVENALYRVAQEP
jgi:PAS domain S-box-containing protein